VSQAKQTDVGSTRERLSEVELPSFEMLSESSDPDITPTRLDIDARALDRALASSPAPEEIELEDILDVVHVTPALRSSSPPRRTTLPPPPARPARTFPPPPPMPSFALPSAPSMPALALLPPGRAPIASIDLILEEDPPEPQRVLASYAPVTVEEPSPWLAESTFVLAPAARSRGRTPGVAWAVGLGLLAGVVVVGVALRSAGAKDAAQLTAASSLERASLERVASESATGVVATPPTPSQQAATAGPSAPTFDVANLPRAPVGTVSLAAAASSHRLIVDGVVAPSGSVVVKCGKHLVRVGSKGRTQIVDVACGGETVVAQ
jgi:hypothetical protein